MTPAHAKVLSNTMAVAFASHDAQLVARVAHEQIEVNRA